MRHMQASPGGGNKLLYETKDERGEIRRRTIDVGAAMVTALVREWASGYMPGSEWVMRSEPSGGSEEGGYLVTFERKVDWEEE